MPVDENQEDMVILGRCLTVREVCDMYDIKDPKTVIMACLTNRVVSRKADAEVGQRGGVWLISATSAFRVWGKRQ